jgi:DNA processing protein
MDAVAMQLVLGRARDLSAQQLQTAIERAGAMPVALSALATLLGERPAALRSLGLSAAASAWMHAPDQGLIEADRAWVERERIDLIDSLSEHYPRLLAQCPAAPALLYIRGDGASLRAAQLAIVGARYPTAPARLSAARFADALVRGGLTITSGLALGIDAAGHEGALAAGGSTVAVLGTGLDQIYPPQHRALAARIGEHGALVSEFPPGTAPLRANFPRRNRIISGLSLGTFVVEAAHHSGSLITARLAAEQGREVFAMPGSIHNPLTRGCHALIRSGAKLVETAQDIFEELEFCHHKQGDGHLAGAGKNPAFRAGRLDKDHKILLDAVGFEPASVDSLVERTGLPIQSVVSMLLNLELLGAIGSHCGGRYVRL